MKIKILFFCLISSLLILNCRARNNQELQDSSPAQGALGVGVEENTAIPEINTTQEFSLLPSDRDLTETVIDTVNQAFLREISVTSPRMNGPDVKFLQERLLELGFTGVGEADGFYGPMTAGEIYFIKAALGFMEYIIFGSDEEEAYYAGTDFDFRSADYQAVNKELWDIIFDPQYNAMLRNISLIRFFDSDPLVWEPEKNSKVTQFKETQLPYTEPDWVPSWGLGTGSKVQKEYNYNAGTNRIVITETVESGWEYVTTDRDFTFQNGLRIRQSTYLESSPNITVRFSVP